MSVAALPGAVIAAAVADARDVLRMPAGEDALLARVSAAAIGIAEAYTGTLLVRREVAEAVAASGAWVLLDQAPVAAISAAGTLPPEAWQADIDGDGRGWVRIARRDGGRETVTYRAGLAETWAEVPAALRQGVALLAAHQFGDRDGATLPPAAVAALWRPWRRLRLTLEVRA